MSSILTICLYLIAPIEADLLENLPADQESIYTNSDLSIRSFESYPEMLWEKKAFWPKVIGHSDDFIFISGIGRWLSKEITSFRTDGSDEVHIFEPGWQGNYYVSIRDGTLYAASTGASSSEMDLYTVSITTGDVIRSLYMPAPAVSSPILYEDNIIVSLLDGYLVALNRDTLVWADRFQSLSTSPMIMHDSMLLFGTSDRYDTPGHYYEWIIRDPASITDYNIIEPSFIALNPLNGEFVWTTHIPAHVAGPAYVVNGFVYTSLDDGSIIALDIERGNLQWSKADCVGQNGKFAVSEEYLICSNQNGTHCIDPDDGSVIWHSDLISYDGSVGIWEDVVFIFDSFYLVALDGDTGERLWHFNRGWPDGVLVIHNNYIFTSGRDNVFCLEMKSQ